MMVCRDVDELITDLQDGRLDAGKELRLHAHVEGCAECRARIETWGVLTPAMRALVPASPSPFDERRMMAEIERRLAHETAASPRPRWRAWLMPASLALATACVLVVWRLWPVAARLPYGTIAAHTGEVRVEGRRLIAAAGARDGAAGLRLACM
ncbi:MAG TPA: zf-HC2 domain-containing protein, partial [Polyangia bacterium]